VVQRAAIGVAHNCNAPALAGQQNLEGIKESAHASNALGTSYGLACTLAHTGVWHSELHQHGRLCQGLAVAL